MAKRAKNRNQLILIAILALVGVIIVLFSQNSAGYFSLNANVPDQCSYACSIQANIMSCVPAPGCTASTDDYPIPCIKCGVTKYTLNPLSIESEGCKVDPFCTNMVVE